MSYEKITALILAAGYSSRMGVFKPLLPLGGEPAIARAISGLRGGGVQDIRVVVGYKADYLVPVLEKLQVPAIFNKSYDLGMFSSVQAGLATLGEEVGGFLLLPGDIPLVKSQTIIQLLEKYKQSQCSVIYPKFLDQRGHPPLITRRCFNKIMAQDFSTNLRSVLQEFEGNACEIQCIDQGILKDMDTPGEYQKLLASLEKRKIPTMAECQKLFISYKVSPSVIKHGWAVAYTAGKLAQGLNELAGYALDLELLLAGGLLHDIAKGQPNHAEKGAAILEGEGYQEVAQVVALHMSLQVNKNHPIIINEAILIYLADKLIAEDQLTTLEQRFAKGRNKYFHDKEILHNIEERLETALILKERIENLLGIDDLYLYLKEQNYGGRSFLG